MKTACLKKGGAAEARQATGAAACSPFQPKTGLQGQRLCPAHWVHWVLCLQSGNSALQASAALP